MTPFFFSPWASGAIICVNEVSIPLNPLDSAPLKKRPLGKTTAKLL